MHDHSVHIDQYTILSVNGTASGHAAAACAPDDPYGGHCRVLVAEVKEKYPHEMTVFCRVFGVFGISSCSRGVEKATRVANTYWVGDNCSWPPTRTHRSGRATREPRTRWLQRRPLFDSFQSSSCWLAGSTGFPGKAGQHISMTPGTSRLALSVEWAKSTSLNLLWSSVFSSEHRETLSSVGRLFAEVVQLTMHQTIPSALDR